MSHEKVEKISFLLKSIKYKIELLKKENEKMRIFNLKMEGLNNAFEMYREKISQDFLNENSILDNSHGNVSILQDENFGFQNNSNFNQNNMNNSIQDAFSQQDTSILSTIHSIKQETRSIDSILLYLKSIFSSLQLKNAEKIVRSIYTKKRSIKEVMSDTGLPKYRIVDIMGLINSGESVVQKNIENGAIHYWIAE